MNPTAAVAAILAVVILVSGIAHELAALAGWGESRPLGNRFALAVALAVAAWLALAVLTASSTVAR